MDSERREEAPKLTKRERRLQNRQAHDEELVIGRRTAIRNGLLWILGTGTAIGGGVILLQNRNNGNDQTPKGIPNQERPTTSSASTWTELTALERIKRLELSRTPGTTEFNATTELIKATAEFFCQQVPTTKTPLQLSSSVSILSPDQFLDALIRTKPAGSNETEAETRDLATTTLEFVDQVDRNIYVSRRRIDQIAQTNAQDPEIKRLLAGRDMRTVLLKGIYFHAYAHASASDEEIELGSIELAPLPGKPVVNRIKTFTLLGSYPDGRSFRDVSTNEALTEYTARLVGKETGAVVGFPAYMEGVRLIEMVNEKAHIEPEEFKQIYTGRKSLEELFQKWGNIKSPSNPNRAGAIMALIAMGIRLGYPEIMSQQEATNSIRGYLSF